MTIELSVPPIDPEVPCPGCGRFAMRATRTERPEFECEQCYQTWHVEAGCAWRTG
jgi:hypothetical protein